MSRPESELIAEICASLDGGRDRVSNAHEQEGYDPENTTDLQTLYLESIAHSLAAIAWLMARRDQDVWEEWRTW